MLGLATTELMKMPGTDLQFLIQLLLQYMVASLRIGCLLYTSPSPRD